MEFKRLTEPIGNIQFVSFSSAFFQSCFLLLFDKNFDKLNQCLKSLNHKFTVIGLTETQLKDKPHDHLQLPDYNLEYMNRTGRNSGGVCLYIRNDTKYKLRSDLCRANSNFESCFIEIENDKSRNIIVGVIYRAHTYPLIVSMQT